jgi:predicted O-linked N-acetylglucosamine transferase (SPINDLY family)
LKIYRTLNDPTVPFACTPMSPQKINRLLEQAIEHQTAGRFTEAEELYRQILAGAPTNFDAVHLLGTLAYQQNRMQEAIDLLVRALKIDPKSAVCRMRLGMALLGAGRLEEAEPQLRQAVALKPDFVEGWNNLAYALKLLGLRDAAVECHQRAIRLKPRYAAGWYNYGHTATLMGQNELALRCHDEALTSDPGYAMAHFGRAQALVQCNRIPEAIAEYDCFLGMQPKYHPARSCRLLALQYVDGISREQIFADHVAYGHAVGPRPAPVFSNTRDPGRQLRIAILSPDLRVHSCAFFLEPLLRHLDRQQFQLALYLDQNREDSMSARLRALSSQWRSFVGQPDSSVENAIRSDQPDILIDLAGHTGMATRLPLYAGRLAPVQITYLGYPDTTGLPAMDFRFTDSIADPVGEAGRFATEKLVRFAPTAWAYLPPEYAPEPSLVPSATGSAVTFGSFNNTTKINATTLRLWAEVLRTVPESRLLIKGFALANNPALRDSLRQGFKAGGVSPDRVRLVDRTPEAKDHLALYRQVDVALDTFPYNGTTTTCEALWMGVPVVTLHGDRHAARVGASLLTAAGHPEWIARDGASYVRIAAELASDPARRTDLRTRLRDDLKRSPLLDHAGQAARFGDALRACWVDWCKKAPTPSG